MESWLIILRCHPNPLWTKGPFKAVHNICAIPRIPLVLEPIAGYPIPTKQRSAAVAIPSGGKDHLVKPVYHLLKPRTPQWVTKSCAWQVKGVLSEPYLLLNSVPKWPFLEFGLRQPAIRKLAVICVEYNSYSVPLSQSLVYKGFYTYY